MRRNELSDEEWSIIQPLLCCRRSLAACRGWTTRRVINGILWRFRTGAPWRGVPERYGPRTTLYNRFARLRAAGVWDGILDAGSEAYDGESAPICMVFLRCRAGCHRLARVRLRDRRPAVIRKVGGGMHHLERLKV